MINYFPYHNYSERNLFKRNDTAVKCRANNRSMQPSRVVSLTRAALPRRWTACRWNPQLTSEVWWPWLYNGLPQLCIQSAKGLLSSHYICVNGNVNEVNASADLTLFLQFFSRSCCYQAGRPVCRWLASYDCAYRVSGVPSTKLTSSPRKVRHLIRSLILSVLPQSEGGSRVT